MDGSDILGRGLPTPERIFEALRADLEAGFTTAGVPTNGFSLGRVLETLADCIAIAACDGDAETLQEFREGIVSTLENSQDKSQLPRFDDISYKHQVSARLGALYGLSTRASRILSERKPPALTVNETRVLQTLYDENKKETVDVSRAAQLPVPNTIGILVNLESRGFISSAQAYATYTFWITGKGKEYLSHITNLESIFNKGAGCPLIARALCDDF